MIGRDLLLGANAPFSQELKSCGILQESQIDAANRSIALLGNNDFRTPLQVGIVLLVDLFTEDEHHKISTLLDRTRFAQVRQLRSMITAAAFGSTAQLRERNHRDMQFLRKRLESSRNCRHFLRAVLESLAPAGHQLQVIDDDQIKRATGLLQASRFSAHLAERNSRSIIDVDMRTGQLFHGAYDFLHIIAPEGPSTHLVRVDSGASTKQPK